MRLKLNLNIYKKTLFYFFCFILVFVTTMGFVFIVMAGNILKKQVSKGAEDYLSQIMYSIDSRISDVNNSMLNLAMNGRVISIINTENSFLDMYSDYLEVMNIINQEKNINRFIDSIHIYVKSTDMVISSNRTMDNLSKFYDVAWFESFKSKSEFFLDTHDINDPTMNRPNPVISLGKSLPANYTDLKYGAIIYNIDEKELNTSINRKKLRDNQTVIMINDEGQIISSEDKREIYKSYRWSKEVAALEEARGSVVKEVKGIKCFITFEDNREYGWKVLSIVPYSEFFSEYTRLLNISMFVCFTALLIFLPLAGITSRDLYNPIKKIIFTLLKDDYNKGVNPVKNELVYLDESIRRILNDKEILSRNLETIRPVAMERFLRNLISNGYETDQDIHFNMETLGISFEERGFTLLLLEVDCANESRVFRNEITGSLFMSDLKETISEFLKDKGYRVMVEKVDDFRIGILLNHSDQSQNISDDIYFVCLELKDRIFSQNQYTVTIGIGEQACSLQDVKSSYLDALKALKQKMLFGKNNVIRIGDIEKSLREDSSYKSEYTHTLIKDLRAMDIDMCGAELNTIIDVMVSKGVESQKMNKFFVELVNSIVFTLYDIRINIEEVYGKGYDMMEDFLKNEDIYDIRKWYMDIFEKLKDYLANRKDNSNSDLINKVKNYVMMNYAKEVTINDIALNVHMNSAYLGRLFKKMDGITFNEYLNSLRMEKAKELLLKTPLKISDVGEKVGIYTSHYFIQCFKSYYGVTPKKFREKNFVEGE